MRPLLVQDKPEAKKTDTKDDQRNKAKQNGMYHKKKCKRGQLSLPPILIFSHILTTTKAESVSIVAGVLVRSHLFSRHTRLAQHFFCVRQFLPALEVVGPRIGPLAIAGSVSLCCKRQIDLLFTGHGGFRVVPMGGFFLVAGVLEKNI